MRTNGSDADFSSTGNAPTNDSLWRYGFAVVAFIAIAALIQKWSREIEIWECKECGQTFLNRRNRVEHRHS